MSEVIRDEAALWHESRQVEIQDYEEPAFIEPEPELEPEDPKEHITDRDVKTELNMLKLSEPTAEIIVLLLDYLMIIPLSLICKGITKEETKLDDNDREVLIKAWTTYLKDKSIDMPPGMILLTSILMVYGSKVAAFHFNKKPEPEFITNDDKKQ